MIHKVIQGDCEKELLTLKNQEFFKGIHLSFLDPPFNQGKQYNRHYDNMPEDEYWDWMERIVKKIFGLTVDGGAIYFMQREKNTEFVLRVLRKTGWRFQNLIIWNKLTTAIPSKIRFNKKYQILAFFTKEEKPQIFNNLRYEPPLLAMHEYERETGMFITDVWDDIRELTSGFFAGAEAIRTKDNEIFTKKGERFHKQQSPIALLTRIILASSKIDDFVLDPFAGTGVTAIVAKQLKRNSISIELDSMNLDVIKKRLKMMREADNIQKFYSKYIYSENLDSIWNNGEISIKTQVENYYFGKKPKIKINETFLMKETVKNVLINAMKIPEELIKFDYRLKDKDNSIHRFELMINIKPQINIIFRLIYAKSLEQADFWVKRINYEHLIVKEKEPNSHYYAVIGGIAFNNIKDILKEKFTNNHLLPFLGWEKTYGLPGFVKKIKSLDIAKDIIKVKQFSLDNF